VPVNDGVNHPADRQPPGQAAAAAARADIAMLTAIPRHWFSWDFTLFEKGVPFAQLAMSLWREKGGFTVGTCRQMDSSAAA
jgi:hypothetical protein